MKLWILIEAHMEAVTGSDGKTGEWQAMVRQRSVITGRVTRRTFVSKSRFKTRDWFIFQVGRSVLA